MKYPGDTNSMSHYILETRPSLYAMDLVAQPQTRDMVRYDGVGLFFCPAAGAEGVFATGRMILNTGEVNPITYTYFTNLPAAEYHYRYEVN